MKDKTINSLDKFSHIGELTSTITHDMKNPLTVIINYTMMIRRNSKNSLDKKSLEQLSFVESEARKMVRQINDVLNYVKLPPLLLESHSLHNILQRVIEKIDIPEGVKINLPNTNPKIISDSEKLEVVFVNIITNAIQAVKSYGEITIRSEKLLDEIVIEIEDTGPGIPEENKDRIFDPLFTTKDQGTGLGLPSCKNIILRHNGTISFQNNPTTFRIIIPIRAS